MLLSPCRHPCTQANAVSDKVLDLRKCDYTGKNLSGKTLAGALLSETNLSNTNLQEAVLTKVCHAAAAAAAARSVVTRAAVLVFVAGCVETTAPGEAVDQMGPALQAAASSGPDPRCALPCPALPVCSRMQ
jgi:hypothetical protein